MKNNVIKLSIACVLSGLFFTPIRPSESDDQQNFSLKLIGKTNENRPKFGFVLAHGVTMTQIDIALHRMEAPITVEQNPKVLTRTFYFYDGNELKSDSVSTTPEFFEKLRHADFRQTPTPPPHSFTRNPSSTLPTPEASPSKDFDFSQYQSMASVRFNNHPSFFHASAAGSD